ncbi:MAG TPA: gluconate 2-dehydrogenase subunit 3 family protein [Verrucomicrobiae bacterium]|nr:gluconate 2-dehydrogenase subunit 3 family protein [Verrucomicrobiae bacterium]
MGNDHSETTPSTPEHRITELFLGQEASTRVQGAGGTPALRPILSRRDLIRAALLAGASSALGPLLSFAQTAAQSGQTPASELTPAQRGVDDSNELADPNWKPLFLSDQQNETLIAISDMIIPATDTPGAKAALVNRFLDLVLAAEESEVQHKFVSSLTFIDSESQRLMGKEFRALTADEQNEILRPLAYSSGGHHFVKEHSDPAVEHFERLKSGIAMAYYTSEIGMRELGWDGSITHGPYQGCEHSASTHSTSAHSASTHKTTTHK